MRKDIHKPNKTISNIKKELFDLILYFKDNGFNIKHEIKIRLRKNYRYQGTIEDNLSYFTIVLRYNVKFEYLNEVLIHELAHYLAGWPLMENENTHTDEWGMWYARLYTCYLNKK